MRSTSSLFSWMKQTAVANAWPMNWAAIGRLARSLRIAPTGFGSKPPPCVRFSSRSPSFWKRFSRRSRVSSSVSSAGRWPFSSSGIGAMPDAPTIIDAIHVADWRSPPTPTEFSP